MGRMSEIFERLARGEITESEFVEQVNSFKWGPSMWMPPRGLSHREKEIWALGMRGKPFELDSIDEFENLRVRHRRVVSREVASAASRLQFERWITPSSSTSQDVNEEDQNSGDD